MNREYYSLKKINGNQRGKLSGCIPLLFNRIFTGYKNLARTFLILFLTISIITGLSILTVLPLWALANSSKEVFNIVVTILLVIPLSMLVVFRIILSGNKAFTKLFDFLKRSLMVLFLVFLIYLDAWFFQTSLMVPGILIAVMLVLLFGYILANNSNSKRKHR